MAPLPPTGTLACVGAAFGHRVQGARVRARPLRRRVNTTTPCRTSRRPCAAGKERDLLTEARYWLAETYYRLDRFPQADALFRQVARGPRTADFTVWSLHSSGWTALRLNDMLRARDTFAQFQSATPPELEAWARHGLGLASYALGRHDDAVAAWTAARGAPARFAGARRLVLARRDARPRRAVRRGRSARSPSSSRGARIRCSSPAALAWAGGASRPSAIRRAWRRFAAYLTSPTGHRPGAAVGRSGPRGGALPVRPRRGARDAARPRGPPLAARGAAPAPAGARDGRGARSRARGAARSRRSCCGATLTIADPRARARCSRARAIGSPDNRDEARTQYELSQRMEPASPTGWYAAYRLAQSNFELREYTQAARDLSAVVTAAPTPDARGRRPAPAGRGGVPRGRLRDGGGRVPARAHRRPGSRAGAGRPARARVGPDASRPARRCAAQSSSSSRRRIPRAIRDSRRAGARVRGGARKDADREEARKLLERVITTLPERATNGLRPAQSRQSSCCGWATRRAPKRRCATGSGGRRFRRSSAGRRPRSARRSSPPASRSKRRRPSSGRRPRAWAPLASLGLGATSLAEGQWAQASSKLHRGARRRHGRGGGRRGLRARGGRVPARRRERVQAAGPGGPGARRRRRARAPRLLYVLTGDRRWTRRTGPAPSRARSGSRPIFPTDEAADDGFERVGAGAAAAGAWPP